MYKDRAARTAAKKAAAAALKLSVREVNRMGMCEEPLESVQKRAEKAENARKHREICIKHAKMVLNRDISPRNAAEACDITVRQMNRWVARVRAGEA